MNNFTFENSTKVFFGKNCVNEHLADVLRNYGKNVLLAYGGGSIIITGKNRGTLPFPQFRSAL